jgi:hypothetical protein
LAFTPDRRALATAGLKAIAVLAGFIGAGFALGVAVAVIWPTPAGVLIAAVLLAVISAAGGAFVVTVMRGGAAS